MHHNSTPVELSTQETRLVLLEAEAAKLNRRLENLRLQAEDLFKGAGKLEGVRAPMGRETVLEIKATLNLASVKPEAIHEVADKFAEIVKEIKRLLKYKEKLDEELSRLHVSNKIDVRIEFQY